MKNILIVLLFCLGFSLDKDWQVFGKHEISINSIIIEFKDEYAPLLGEQTPLILSELVNLKNIDKIDNFKSIQPLFRTHETFHSPAHTARRVGDDGSGQVGSTQHFVCLHRRPCAPRHRCL